MLRFKWDLVYFYLFVVLFYAGIELASAQFESTATEKIWQTKQIDVIRSNYIDSDGLPSRDVFLQKHGLWPINQKNSVIPYFSVSFSNKDILEIDKNLKLAQNAKPVSLDFYLKNRTEYQSANKAVPVWDGRVYEENNQIIVGGYSSRFNERPVGRFNDADHFVTTVDNSVESEFPLLNIPAQQIIFDPFEWTVFNIRPTNGKIVQETSKSYLPLTLLDNRGQHIRGIQYSIEMDKDHLFLYGIIANKKIKLAQSHLAETIVDKRRGYQPTVQEGCVHPTGGKVVTFTFKGEFLDIVKTENNTLNLNKSLDTFIHAKQTNKTSTIIDGNFDDWRSVSGVCDPEGDYVSYLHQNPDTDILEFKVSNDDEYLYFYSRLAGAHGRTGETGRYYWYTYIDIDADPNTGYPPTRDDNCYFGIAIGDDCEAQFEFVGNKFIKTFFGFTGLGTEQPALDGKLSLGPSYYAPKDALGQKRDKYKIEYVNRKGSRFITHDNTEGTSEDIIMALSPDGSEMEMRVEFKGFLWDINGKQLVAKGQAINIAIGAEGDSGHLGSDKWGADSSPVIYGYIIK